MRGGKRRGAGRKPIKINLVDLEKLCHLQCTDREIAAFFGVNVRTIERRRRRSAAFGETMARGRASGQISVRRELFRQAKRGKAAALTLLAKGLPVVPVPAPLEKGIKFQGTLTELLQTYHRLTRNAK